MATQTPFINTLYDESLGLLVEARNYLQYSPLARKACKGSDPQDNLFVNYQALRFTSRMTQAMAWLLAQKAVEKGEISPHQAYGGSFSLGEEEVCITNEGHSDGRIPENMRQLLDRSHRLYMRVLRLDHAAKERIAAGLFNE